MKCIELVQSVALRVGLPAPTTATSSTDPMVQQLLELMNEEGRELSARHGWQALRREATFTTLAAETQGTVSALAPGFKSFVNESFWNRSLRRPLFGPLDPATWQQIKAQNFAGPWSHFMVRGNVLLMYPVPAAGQTCAFEYQSKLWVLAVDGITGRELFTRDDDTAYVDDDAMMLGTIWRWRQAKGLEYAEDFRKYELRVADLMGRDGAKPILNLEGAR